MLVEWDYVKKTTLWHYEDLMFKLNDLKTYPTIWNAYNQDMTQAATFARSLFPDNNIEAGEFPAQVLSTFTQLKSAGIMDWGDLLSKIATRAKCAAFVTGHNLDFGKFIDVLNYLLRWAFPFEMSSRELLEHENQDEMACYAVLKQHKIMKSFDFLEHGHTLTGLRTLTDLTCLPLDFMTRLAHRADIGRLPFSRRKTILPVCGAGYDTLAKIAAANLDQMESDLEAYFQRTRGKSFKNYKAVIVLKMLVTGARALPRIMEE